MTENMLKDWLEKERQTHLCLQTNLAVWLFIEHPSKHFATINNFFVMFQRMWSHLIPSTHAIIKWIGTGEDDISFTDYNNVFPKPRCDAAAVSHYQSPKWKWRDSLIKLFTTEKVLLNNIRLKLLNKPARILVSYCLMAVSAVIWLLDKILKKVKRNRESAAEILVPYELLTILKLLLCNEVLKTVKMRSCSADFMILIKYFCKLLEWNNLQISYEYFYFCNINLFGTSFCNCAS